MKVKSVQILHFFKRLALAFFFVSVFFYILISTANAQQSVAPGFSVFPAKFELEVKRDQHLEDRIMVRNRSDVAMPIEAKVLSFTAQDYTGVIQFYGEAIPEALEEIDDISFNPRKWIKIENPNFILDSGEVKEVKFLVDVPEDAEPGGHYAVILFEPKLPSFYFKEGQPRAIPIIGVLFLFSVEVEGLVRTSEPLTIVEFAIPKETRLRKLENLMASAVSLFSKVDEEESLPIVEISHFSLSPLIKNNDIYHIKPSGKLEILTIRGKKVGETEIKKTTILPGKTRYFPIEFKPDLPEVFKKYFPASISNFVSQNLLFGKFKARLLLQVEGIKINEEIEFWAFPWKALLYTCLTLVLIVFILVKYRKRISKAIFVLFRVKNLE